MLFSLAVITLFIYAGKAASDLDLDVEGEDEMAFALKYLSDYHYMSPSKSGNHNVSAAVKKFQKFFHLPETGEVNEETIRQMKKPRCGDPDVDDEGSRFKRYDAVGSWSKTTFTYYIQYSSEDVSSADQQRVISEAFQKWTDACNVLSFTQTDDPSSPDFKISFGSGTHAGIPGEPTDIAKFDGKGGVLSHAYYPSDGRIHFDEDEKWSTEGTTSGWWLWTSTESESLIYLATHEIGHAIGLGHSNDVNSVMLPTVDLGNPSLATDDVNGVNALYTC